MRVIRVTPDQLRPEDVIFDPETGKFWTIDDIRGDVTDDKNTFTGPYTSWDIWRRELRFNIDATFGVTESELHLDNIIDGSDVNEIVPTDTIFWKLVE